MSDDELFTAFLTSPRFAKRVQGVMLEMVTTGKLSVENLQRTAGRITYAEGAAICNVQKAAIKTWVSRGLVDGGAGWVNQEELLEHVKKGPSRCNNHTGPKVVDPATIPCREAADVSGISPENLRKLISRNKVQGGSGRVNKDSLIKYMAASTRASVYKAGIQGLLKLKTGE